MDLLTILTNLSHSYPQIFGLMMDVSLLMGVGMTIWGLNALRPNSWYRERGGNPVGGLWSIAIGSFLIFFPSALDAASQTLFAANTAKYEFAYDASSAAGLPSNPFGPVKLFIQLFGIYAYINGLVSLRSYGVHGARGNVTLKSSIVWLISGCLLVNIDRLVSAAAGSFGLTNSGVLV